MIAKTTILDEVKFRCGIPAAVTVYDSSELISLIEDVIDDMRTAGVPEKLLPEAASGSSAAEADADSVNPRVKTAIVLYVQGMRGQDRTDSAKYIRSYRNKLHKLMLEPEEEESVYVDDSDIIPGE